MYSAFFDTTKIFLNARKQFLKMENALKIPKSISCGSQEDTDTEFYHHRCINKQNFAPQLQQLTIDKW